MDGEKFSPDFEEDREDSRTELADCLRDFLMQAIEQQKVIDADERRTRSAGSLYKIDGGFLKVHLQSPAADHVFHGEDEGAKEIPESLPNIWILVPITELDKEFELEDLVLAAEDIVVHVLPESGEPVQFLSRDDYLGPLVPAFTTVDEMLAFRQPEDLEQVTSAQNWKQLLDGYDIRTIAASNTSQTDVA